MSTDTSIKIQLLLSVVLFLLFVVEIFINGFTLESRCLKLKSMQGPRGPQKNIPSKKDKNLFILGYLFTLSTIEGRQALLAGHKWSAKSQFETSCFRVKNQK
jgi:hypothetical protein